MQLNSHNFMPVYDELGVNLDTLGCVMADVEPTWNMSLEVNKDLPGLYKTSHPDRKWIDGWVAGKVAHVTLLYGLLENAHAWEKYVKAVLEGWSMPTVEIDSVGYFDSPYPDDPYYCIVAHLKLTPELMEGHNRLEFLPHINTFTGYKPHMTICYIEKNDALRDSYAQKFDNLWGGMKLNVKDLNLGYLPK